MFLILIKSESTYQKCKIKYKHCKLRQVSLKKIMRKRSKNWNSKLRMKKANLFGNRIHSKTHLNIWRMSTRKMRQKFGSRLMRVSMVPLHQWRRHLRRLCYIMTKISKFTISIVQSYSLFSVMANILPMIHYLLFRSWRVKVSLLQHAFCKKIHSGYEKCLHLIYGLINFNQS